MTAGGHKKMFSRILCATQNLLPVLFFACVGAVSSSSSFAQQTSSDINANSPNDRLKFNTDSAPVSTDYRAPMIFKNSDETPVGAPRKEYSDNVPEDAGFKAYIGYPKHQVGIYAAPQAISSKWTGAKGEGYNFTNATTALGLNYRLLASPLWKVEVDYQHYELKMDAASANPFSFIESSATFDNFYIRNSFCLVSKWTFQQQLCPGVDIGNDGYPIVNYVTNKQLVLVKVQDIMVGLNLAYQYPISDVLLFRAMIGYNYGTGLGNSGYLTSQNNSSYFANANLEWSLSQQNTIQFGAELKARQAKVSGQIGPNTDSWQTDSTAFGGKLGYIRTF